MTILLSLPGDGFILGMLAILMIIAFSVYKVRKAFFEGYRKKKIAVGLLVNKHTKELT
jgi:hypothetical protein